MKRTELQELNPQLSYFLICAVSLYTASFLHWTFTLEDEIAVLSQNVQHQSLSAMTHTHH